MSELSPLSGVKLKSEFGAVRAAFDPQRTSFLRATHLDGYIMLAKNEETLIRNQ